MAHEFVILNTSGVTTTYTSYESIPVDSTLKNVIKFVPDLGTLVDANEILIEDTPDTGFFDKIIPEDWTTSSENHLVLETSDDSIADNHYHPPTQDHHRVTSRDSSIMDILNSSGDVIHEIFGNITSSGSDFIIKNSSNTTLRTIKQTPSSSPSETFLVKNSSGTVITTLTFSSVEINSGTEILRDDDHTPEEHREIALWDYKLQVLMKQERENASSN